MQTLTINNQVYEPKLNFAFYKQTRDDKSLKDNNSDGFSAVVNGLLEENVDMIVAVYYHSLAYYKRNQPTEDDVEAALEELIFVDDDKTNQAFADIFADLKAFGFLARKLSESLKELNRNADLIEKRINGMDDGTEKEKMLTGLEYMQTQIEKLKQLLTGQESSPKPLASASPSPISPSSPQMSSAPSAVATNSI